MKTDEVVKYRNRKIRVFDSTTAYYMTLEEGYHKWLMDEGFSIRGYLTSKNQLGALNAEMIMQDFFQLIVEETDDSAVIFFVTEINPARSGYHLNILAKGNFRPEDLERLWHKLFGGRADLSHCKIMPISDPDRAVKYALKFVNRRWSEHGMLKTTS